MLPDPKTSTFSWKLPWVLPPLAPKGLLLILYFPWISWLLTALLL